MKKNFIPFFLITLLVLISGCDLFTFPDSPLYDYSLTYIDKVTIRDAVEYPEPWYIQVSGHLPTGAQELDHVELLYGDQILTITPVARLLLSGSETYENVPYTKNFYFTPDTKGHWKVYANGIKDTLSYNVLVY